MELTVAVGEFEADDVGDFVVVEKGTKKRRDDIVGNFQLGKIAVI